jgi:hypothetical protein
MMQTCKTCRHWASDDFLSRQHGAGYSYCLRIDFAYQQNRSRAEAPLASLYDAGGADALLATMADFGCVMHEPDTETVHEDDGA